MYRYPELIWASTQWIKTLKSLILLDKNSQFGEFFAVTCGQIVLPDRSILIGQNLM